MLYFTPYKKKFTTLASFLPWAYMPAPGIVLNKDGSFMRVFEFRGVDVESSTEAYLLAYSARLNNVFKRLDERWAVFVESQRRHCQVYPDSVFPDPASQMLDDDRRSRFQDEGDHYASRYFLSFVYLPPQDQAAQVTQFFYDRQGGEYDHSYAELMQKFINDVRQYTDVLGEFLPSFHPLTTQETLEYLHSTISTKSHPILPPIKPSQPPQSMTPSELALMQKDLCDVPAKEATFEKILNNAKKSLKLFARRKYDFYDKNYTDWFPAFIDSFLCDQTFYGGIEPRLGEHHVQIISFKSYPGASTPALMDKLNYLPMAFRWTTRYIPLSKQDAMRELRSLKRKWWAKRKSPLTMVVESFTKGDSVMVDEDAVLKADDAGEALLETQEDLVNFGYFTTTIIVTDPDLTKAKEKRKRIEALLNGQGFVTLAEEINAVDAFLGSVPGNCQANVRRPMLSSMNLVHLCPFQAQWAGPDENKHLGGPPVFYALSSGNTPFRFVNHIQDVGHTLIVGPTGSGKSFLLSFLAMQFRRYPAARVIIFDKDRSCLAATRCVGGDFYDLSSDSDKESLVFQPLGAIDDSSEMQWAFEWILELLIQEGMGDDNKIISPSIKKEIWDALELLRANPNPAQRSLTNLLHLIQSREVREALATYTTQGPFGFLLDAEKDNLQGGDWMAFEMSTIMQQPKVVPAVLLYLFHRIERRLDGSPTLIILDEAWVFLDNVMFSDKIREWLKVLRKKNASVIFGTQSLKDIEESAIFFTIIQSCHTKIFLPDSNALDATVGPLYEKFGLNDRQRELLATATPKRDYYYVSQTGNRMFSLGAQFLERAFCGASKPEDIKQIEAIYNDAGKENFLRAYLQNRLDEQAKLLAK